MSSANKVQLMALENKNMDRLILLAAVALLVNNATAVANFVDTGKMRLDVTTACARGACYRHSNTSATVKPSTDCAGRLVAYEFSLSLQPNRAPQSECILHFASEASFSSHLLPAVPCACAICTIVQSVTSGWAF
jgi:hypothetical protein